MKYMTKVEWILSDEDYMMFSSEAFDHLDIAQEKAKRPIDAKLEWSVFNKRIKRKLKNPKSVVGICTCDSDFLCEHRKKYLKEALDGEAKG
jgi:hypothetical protein